MKRQKRTTLPLGTISEGTLRPEDLIPAYLSALGDIRLTKAERATVREIQKRESAERILEHVDLQGAQDQMDEAGYDLDELATILESHCPDYAYFGSLEGDGACFGVWPSIDSLEENCITRDRYLDYNDPRKRIASVVKLDAGDPNMGAVKRAAVHDGMSHIMEVSDHGNVTLYRRSGNRWIEVWSVV